MQTSYGAWTPCDLTLEGGILTFSIRWEGTNQSASAEKGDMNDRTRIR
jgi:hypothetical protein